jgi:hypothetical protein
MQYARKKSVDLIRNLSLQTAEKITKSKTSRAVITTGWSVLFAVLLFWILVKGLALVGTVEIGNDLAHPLTIFKGLCKRQLGLKKLGRKDSAETFETGSKNCLLRPSSCCLKFVGSHDQVGNCRFNILATKVDMA